MPSTGAENRGKDILSTGMIFTPEGINALMKTFIDTNVIVYANDSREKQKQAAAVEIITSVMREGTGVISTQVLQEYSAVALRKLNQDPHVVLHQLKLLSFFETITILPALVQRGIEMVMAYRINFWDACILSAAEKGECGEVYSEDLNPGQIYSGIKVVNPFKS
jgi:predicted nucleic acid-binding protein